MKNSCSVLLFAFFLFFFPAFASPAGVTHANVSVTSVSNGAVLFASINQGATVTVDPTNTTGAVWFIRTGGTCSTTLSGPAGTRLSRDSSKDGDAWYFDPVAEHWNGQVCVILDAGSGSVLLITESW